jgi:hypothetical protein
MFKKVGKGGETGGKIKRAFDYREEENILRGR